MEKQVRRNSHLSRIEGDETGEESITLLSSELSSLERPCYSRSGTHFQNFKDKKNVSCGDCSERVRVKNISELCRGQHIEMPGQKKSRYDENEKKRTWKYMHHAVVTNVIARGDSKIEVEVVHMLGYGFPLSKTRETYDLKYDQLYVIHYYHPLYSPERIARRAEKAYENDSSKRDKDKHFESYSILSNNCEHFATWCVVGETATYESQYWIEKKIAGITKFGYSRQVMKWVSRIVEAFRYLFGHGSKAMHFILKFLHASSDEISTFLSKIIPSFIPSAKTILAGASSLYVLYCISYTVYLYRRKENASICKHCYDEKIAEMWSKLSIYGITSAVTFYMVQGSVSIPIVLGSLVLIVFSIALQYYIPTIRKKLLAPYCCSKKGISQLDELEIADIVTVSYYGFPHDILITEIHPDEKNKNKCKLRAVHYATDNILSKRTIREDDFNVNTWSLRALLFWQIKRHECQHLQSFPAERAIARARKRIGEQKWHPITNRSDHLCYWAKISEPVLIENEEVVPAIVQECTKSSILSSWFIGENEVHLSEEIEIGDIIRYRGKECFVIEKSGEERSFYLELAYVKGQVVIKTFRINLDTDSVQVLSYHPVHCFDKPTRAEHAKKLKGDSLSVKEFKEKCVLKKDSNE